MESIEVSEYKFICFTDAGKRLMQEIAEKLSSADAKEGRINKELSLGEWTESVFQKGNILIYIGAVGIAVRAIAPFVDDKTKDPGVIVIDEQGKYVIPILSGHIGGAVDASRRLAKLIGAKAVITTASDLRGEFSVDVFATKNNMAISDIKMAKEFTSDFLRSGKAFYSIDERFEDEIHVNGIPENIKFTRKTESPQFFISPQKAAENSGDNKEFLKLIPQCIVAGIGCRKGKSSDELSAFLMSMLETENIDVRAIKAICSIDIKKDEPGLVELSENLAIPFITYSSTELMEQQGDFSSSEFALEVTGADNVCERSVMAYGCKRLIFKKTARDGMTLALGIMDTFLDYMGELPE
ncbi:cobalt-precorrin 5A hydrolase [Butyrivibrio sp. WCD2001]|uniref:cobalt-precorrin 5A hydrolase n=1 Tax=Butyrivibrio sp. WCD2001 TaxID=1280681 RepID=UPI0003FB437D|nr:cobalamin biosynthesis protein [Butyrivibrio sp. WCD2001]